MTTPQKSELLDLFTVKPAICTYEVPNFLTQTSYVTSPQFYQPNETTFKFNIRIYPNETVTQWAANHAVVTLSVCNPQREISVYYRIALVNEKGEKCNWKEERAKFSRLSGNTNNNYCNISFNGQYNINRTYLQTKANGLLPDGTLTVYCEVYVLNDQCVASGLNKDNLISLSKNYQTLLDTGKSSDVVLAAGKQEFKAHKLILSTQSAVFAAMFEHDLEESKKNRVEITDMSAEALKDLLKFIYTGQIVLLDQNACELFAAADKYQIESLKSFCEHYLAMTLSVNSVPNVFYLAELYNLEQLKTKCMNYMSQHSAEFKFEDWKELTEKRPELSFKLFQLIGGKLQSKS